MTTQGNDGWVTYADAETLARKSLRTLRRVVANGEVRSAEHDGRVLLKVEDLVEKGWVRDADLVSAVGAAQAAELMEAREDLRRLRVEVGELRGRLVERDEHLRTLKDQLAEKDRQLSRVQSVLQTLAGSVGRRP